jgi:hypothetical protein
VIPSGDKSVFAEYIRQTIRRHKAEKGIMIAANVDDAAREVVKRVDEVKKGKSDDWPNGNPTPEQWKGVCDAVDDLADEI